MTFTILSATTAATTPALGGGDASYKFKWESNINGGGWGLAPVVSNGTGYNPGELPEKIPSNEYYFRRVVYSGKHDVCVNTSAPVLLRDFPVITNNTITATQTICSGSAPAKLIGPQPLNGNGVFTYTWQDSSASHPVSDPWVDIPGEINSTVPDYQPLALTETTSYRRKAFSSACSNISNSIKIVVHKPILNNSISLLAGALTDTTICNGQIPHLFKGTNATGGISTYAYQWLDSIATTNWSLAPGAGTGVYYQPPALTATTYYKRQVISGACTVISSATITVTVLPLITNNVISSPDLKVCFNSVPALITGTTPSGGAGEGTYLYSWEQSTDEGVNWTDAEGVNNSLSGSYQPPALITETQYKRAVKSAGYDCTTNASGPVIIGIDPLPGKPYSGPDTSIYSVEKIYHMKADKELTGETGLWTILSHVTSTIDDITNNNTIIRNLSAGKNFFLWTVSKGPCDLSDSVYIELLEDFVPQGFSPNGDAWNNTFKIEGLNLEDQFVDLSVVNGAGSEVFSTSNRDGVENWKYWDGKNSKGIDLPEGTYYYLLKITSKANGQVFKKSGFIVLKRY
jgi:gliding motility-associated-like protein